MPIFNGVALVTGAASVDRDAKKLNDTDLAIKETFQDVQVLAVPTDISKQEDIERLYSETIETFGRVDYVVNGAGKSCLATEKFVVDD
ncbi:hypothetical protein J7337_013295 [Fusarium musae]|uniref:Uncharacterized protein n=1 Tax=Fusarium musae TaxID=1042133 RepID=A0A9P8D497_9HYPO|nr:hypothetical protein J7337_013295 [Fusarium musae]KAG9495062.1 hypothetical protein J7337_013295 [Fusarium musae]